MWDLVVDARKPPNVGIGTCIRNVVPRVRDRLTRTVRAAAREALGHLRPYNARRVESRIFFMRRRYPIHLLQEV